MVSLNRVQKLVKAMVGEVIAESSLLKFVLRLYHALEAWELDAIEQLLKAPAINVDETSLRVDKLNHWLPVYSAGHITLKFLHRKRGKAAIEASDIIPRYGGKIIHDCWASYLSYLHCGHGLLIPPKPSGKRGKLAKSDAHNLLERMQSHETSVLLFAKDPHVSFTNNRAERDLRMAKVKQKVSGCFRTEAYALAYCRISSYLQTMANKGYNPLIAVQMALAGELDSIRGE